MNKPRTILLGLLGAVFLAAGLYYRIFAPAGSSLSYEYLGIGTWSAGVVYYVLFPKYKELASFILGLLVLHAGVLLIIKESYSNPRLLGALVFTAGIIIVLGSGFSEYMKSRKTKK